MEHVVNGDARIAWRSDGDAGKPALFLCNSIGTDHTVWEIAMPQLTQHFRVIRMDTRGHGESDAPNADYTLNQLAGDIEAVATAADLEQFDLCGVSLGAMMAMAYAVNQPQRLRRLVLCNTSTNMDPQAWQQRMDTVRTQGLAAIADMAMSRFFTPEYVERNDPALQQVRERFLKLSPEGYTGCCAAIRDMALTEQLHRIQVPTLVLTGARDVSTPHAAGQAIAERIPGAQIRQLPAAHIPANEAPELFCEALVDFLID